MNELSQLLQKHEIRQQQVLANLRASVQMVINGASAELAQQRQEFYSQVSVAIAKAANADEVAVSANA